MQMVKIMVSTKLSQVKPLVFRGTVVSWDPVNSVLVVQDVTPYNTGDTNVGVNGFLYEFSDKGTIVDFFIQSAGTNYSAVPTVTIENTGDIEATATANMTTAGDQVASLTITNGGYGIPQTIDGTYNFTRQLHSPMQ